MSVQQICKTAVSVWMLALPILAADNAFVGTWKLNAAKSKFSAGAPAMKSANVRVEVVANSLKSTVDGIYSDGQPFNYVVQAPLDGAPGPITGSPAMDTSELKLVDPHTITAVGKKDGKLVFTDKRVVSNGDKTLTISRSGTAPGGQQQYTATLVFERQ